MIPAIPAIGQLIGGVRCRKRGLNWKHALRVLRHVFKSKDNVNVLRCRARTPYKAGTDPS